MPESRQLQFDFPGVLSQPIPESEKAETQPKTNRQPQHGEEQPTHAARDAEGVVETDRAAAETTPSFPVIRGRVLDGVLTQQCRALVTDLDMLDLSRQLRVFWNSRLTTTAGLAHYSDWTIELNPRLREFQPTEPDRTMRHELAHLVAQFRAGARRIRAHGVQWQRACAELGIPGEKRCHDLPLQRRQVRRKFAYQCKNCGVVVPRVRKLARHSACWSCCQDLNAGRYSSRFLLLPIPLDEAKVLAPDATW